MSDNPADGFGKSRTIIYSEKSAHEYILRNLFTEKSVDFESISIRFQQYIYKMYNPVNFPCRTNPTSFGRALTDSLRKGHQRESNPRSRTNTHYFMYTQRERAHHVLLIELNYLLPKQLGFPEREKYI
jgi:hypothetical protein